MRSPLPYERRASRSQPAHFRDGYYLVLVTEKILHDLGARAGGGRLVTEGDALAVAGHELT